MMKRKIFIGILAIFGLLLLSGCSKEDFSQTKKIYNIDCLTEIAEDYCNLNNMTLWEAGFTERMDCIGRLTGFNCWNDETRDYEYFYYNPNELDMCKLK